jgi:hypothetical protein
MPIRMPQSSLKRRVTLVIRRFAQDSTLTTDNTDDIDLHGSEKLN